MHQTRRSFLAVSAAGAAAVIGGAPLAAAARAPRPSKGLRILILGGTGFLGPATVRAAQARGHTLTLFNRGRTEKRKGEIFPDVEKLYGNRDPNKPADETKDDKGNLVNPDGPKGLESLKGGSWDVVIDNSGYYPRLVKASAELLAPAARQYIYISSISAYKDPSKPDQDETADVATMDDPTLETMGPKFEYYGPLKALCEKAAMDAFSGRAAVVRPGFIVGPEDPTDRFTYWPVRIDKARKQDAEMIAPGSAADPIQIIDVRDLGEWLITLAESNSTGFFNAVSTPRALSMGSMLDACRAACGSDPKITWIDPVFLEKHEIGFHIWAPPTGDTAGFHLWKNDRAVAAGLKFRAVQDTCRATLDWFNAQPEARQQQLWKANPPMEREKAVLEAWHAEHK